MQSIAATQFRVAVSRGRAQDEDKEAESTEKTLLRERTSMASAAYSLEKVFFVSPRAERLLVEAQHNSYIDLREFEGDPYGEHPHESMGIVGSSPALSGVLEQLRTVAPTDSTVLIEGETGTGKELIARAVHTCSGRRAGPFVKLNCAAIPADLLESELFGHEKGAFTGAVSQKPGRFEAANRGTLLLDEVGDMPLNLQAKLLRVLQEQEFERLGSVCTRKADVRVVAATNQDLASRVAEKQFRPDLYYRLNVFPITIPPLRQRLQDIPVLVAHFVRKFNQRMSKQISRISTDAMDALMRYPWPGNIRELQNLVERAVILTKGEVLQVPSFTSHPLGKPQRVTLFEVERDHIMKVLEESNWVVGGKFGAAARLGMPRTTLITRMQKFGLSRENAQSERLR